MANSSPCFPAFARALSSPVSPRQPFSWLACGSPVSASIASAATARNGELVLVSNRPFVPVHGEIVILGLVGGGGSVDAIIKRVIGLPGDTIELRDGTVFLNGVMLDEPYLVSGSTTEPGRAGTVWSLGPDEYFVLGDNRAQSSDSRYFGPCRASMLLARPLFRYWPLDRTGPLN